MDEQTLLVHLFKESISHPLNIISSNTAGKMHSDIIKMMSSLIVFLSFDGLAVQFEFESNANESNDVPKINKNDIGFSNSLNPNILIMSSSLLKYENTNGIRISVKFAIKCLIILKIPVLS